jgi:mannose-6-phosphate isomerase-like protein (cupin superfamily)/DNA-binding XRE family transcriptional regulator
MDPFEITVLPVADRNVALISHHHEEFFCVLSGTVECVIETPDGRARERLAPGDCMYFRSHLPHCIRAVGGAPAHSIHTLCPAPGDTETEHTEGSIAPIYLRNGDEGFRSEMAAKVRALRQRRGMTRPDAAAALAISERKLAAIESGSRSLGLDLLVRLCATFGKPLEYFLASALIVRPFYAVQRARGIGRLRPRPRRDTVSDTAKAPRSTFKSLAEAFGARGMYPYYVTVSSDASGVAVLHDHHGEEFVYVLNGEVTLVTIVEGSRVTETLGRGDSCYIDSTVPHRFIASAASPYHQSGAEVLDVFWCPLGEDYLFDDAPNGLRKGPRTPRDRAARTSR